MAGTGPEAQPQETAAQEAQPQAAQTTQEAQTPQGAQTQEASTQEAPQTQENQPHAHHFEVDPDFVGDNDSAIDADSFRESTASLTSSIREYRTIHGRTYQSSKSTEYWAPNDEKHVEAFEVAHHWLTMMQDDKLFLAPIAEKPGRILDVGTGSGIWAIDMADEYPDAEVIGTDISPTQPTWIPPNLSFQIDDAQLDWTFESNSFDFIHVRYMHAAIDDWDKFYRQMYRCLKPGGWFQHTEPNIELRGGNPAVPFGEDDIYKTWAKLFYDAGDKIGRSFRFDGDIMTRWPRDAGFDNITHKKITVPHGPWPKNPRLKELGTHVSLYMDLSLDGFAIYPIGEILGWTMAEVDVLVAKMRKSMRNAKNLSNSDMHVVYGQKPLKEEAA